MKNPLNIFSFILLFLLLVIVWIVWFPLTPTPVASPISQATDEGFPLVDSDEWVLPALPQRIVSQTLMTDEVLLAICPPSRLVAVSTLAHDPRYSSVVETARSFQAINQNVEQILMLNPDLIFVASYSSAETVMLLQATGAPVLRLTHFDNLAAIKANILTIGEAIGEKQRAIDLVEQMMIELAAIRARIPDNVPPPRVISYSSDHYTAGGDTSFDNMVTLVGAINVVAAAGLKHYMKVSEEQILQWQPDFIVTHGMHDEFAVVKQQLLKNPAIAASQAGQRGNIIVIESQYFLSVSQYIIRGIEALAKGLYQLE